MLNPEETFNSLVRQYSQPLYWHVRSIVGDHDDADDVVQETFIKVWKGLPSFRGDSDPFTWLWRIATNTALTHVRKQKIRSIFGRETTEMEMVPGDCGFNPDEASRKLARAVEKLPPKQRSVFSMRYFQELSYAQMSEITGTSEGALKASYHIAEQKVRESIQEAD